MPTPSVSSPIRLRAGRLAALSLLIAVVSLGHVSVPWVLETRLQHLEFQGNARQAAPLVTREITHEPPPPAPPHPAPREAPPKAHTTPPITGRPPQHQTATPDAGSTQTPAVGAQPPTPDDGQVEGALLYTISGHFGGHPVGGSARLQLRVGPSAYLASLDVTGSQRFSTLFVWQLKTRGIVEGHSLRPDAYDETLQFTGEARSSRSVAFAPEPGAEDALRPDTTPRLDPLSAVLRMSSDLHSRPAPAASSPSSGYPIVVRLGHRSLHLNFEREGDELLSTPYGPVQTEKYVTKNPNAFYEGPAISLWLAPGYRHALVRIEIRQEDLTALRFELQTEPTDFPAWR